MPRIATCPYCGKGKKNLKLHARWCEKKPLEEITVAPPEDESVPEQAMPEILARAGRTFLPFPSHTAPNSQDTLMSWFLRPRGALPEDAFCAADPWSAGQREQIASWGLTEVTPSKPGSMTKNSQIVGAFVVLDPPPPKLWQRVLAILEKRRLPALEAERLRLADMESDLNDAVGIPQRASVRHRVRNCKARIAYLDRPVDEDGSLYNFVVEEARASRRVLQTEQGRIEKIVDERIADLMGEEEAVRG